jgi:hypothetical protein
MVEWRYLPGRGVIHALNRSFGWGSLCGVTPSWFRPVSDWRGTGTQEEYETAEQLPRCKRCVRILGDDPAGRPAE